MVVIPSFSIPLEWIFLPVIILLGIITGYQDIKYGKIRNRWIIYSLIYSLLVYLVLISFYFFTGMVNKTYILELFTNFLFAVAVGFGLWYFKVWTAGDGKLFIAFAVLIPFGFYSNSYFKFIPSINLLINIFVIGLIVMLIFMLIFSKFRYYRKAFIGFLKISFGWRNFLSYFILIFVISWLVQISLTYFGLGKNLVLIFFITFLFLLALKFNRKIIYPLIFISVLRIFLDSSIHSVSAVLRLVLLLVSLTILMGFIGDFIPGIGRQILSSEVLVSKLKPGMILAESVFKQKKLTPLEKNAIKNAEGQQIKIGKFHYFRLEKQINNQKSIFLTEAEGLTEEQIVKLKKIGFRKIRVARTIPFAPFIFSGVILTILIKGNIIYFLKSLS